MDYLVKCTWCWYQTNASLNECCNCGHKFSNPFPGSQLPDSETKMNKLIVSVENRKSYSLGCDIYQTAQYAKREDLEKKVKIIETEHEPKRNHLIFVIEMKNKRIEMIKELRDVTQWGLKESQGIIDYCLANDLDLQVKCH